MFGQENAWIQAYVFSFFAVQTKVVQIKKCDSVDQDCVHGNGRSIPFESVALGVVHAAKEELFLVLPRLDADPLHLLPQRLLLVVVEPAGGLAQDAAVAAAEPVAVLVRKGAENARLGIFEPYVISDGLNGELRSGHSTISSGCTSEIVFPIARSPFPRAIVYLKTPHNRNLQAEHTAG